MKKTVGILAITTLLLAGCSTAPAAKDDAGGNNDSASQPAITLNSKVKIDDRLTLTVDESALPEGWTPAPPPSADESFKMDPETSADFENVEGCYFYVRTIPEVVPGATLDLDESFVTNSLVQNKLVSASSSGLAGESITPSEVSSSGGQIELATIKIVTPPLPETADGSISLTSTQIFAQRAFNTNTEPYTIPDELKTEETRNMPAPDLVSVPAITAAAQCPGDGTLEQETFDSLLNAVEINNIAKES